MYANEVDAAPGSELHATITMSAVVKAAVACRLVTPDTPGGSETLALNCLLSKALEDEGYQVVTEQEYIHTRPDASPEGTPWTRWRQTAAAMRLNGAFDEATEANVEASLGKRLRVGYSVALGSQSLEAKRRRRPSFPTGRRNKKNPARRNLSGFKLPA